MAWAERPGRAFAMDEETSRRFVDVVLFDLTGIMGEIQRAARGRPPATQRRKLVSSFRLHVVRKHHLKNLKLET